MFFAFSIDLLKYCCKLWSSCLSRKLLFLFLIREYSLFFWEMSSLILVVIHCRSRSSQILVSCGILLFRMFKTVLKKMNTWTLTSVLGKAFSQSKNINCLLNIFNICLGVVKNCPFIRRRVIYFQIKFGKYYLMVTVLV